MPLRWRHAIGLVVSCFCHVKLCEDQPMKFAVGVIALICASTVSSSPVEAQDQIVEFRLRVEDASGATISEVTEGSDFTLSGYVVDLREPPQGVFSAYADVLYGADLVSVSGPIETGPAFPNGASGNSSTPGIIDEIGSFDGLMPADLGPLLLFSVPFTADAIGMTEFNLDPADILPTHETLVFNADVRVPPEAQRFVGVSLEIVPEPSGLGAAVVAGVALIASVRKRRHACVR